MEIMNYDISSIWFVNFIRLILQLRCAKAHMMIGTLKSPKVLKTIMWDHFHFFVPLKLLYYYYFIIFTYLQVLRLSLLMQISYTFHSSHKVISSFKICLETLDLVRNIDPAFQTLFFHILSYNPPVLQLVFCFLVICCT